MPIDWSTLHKVLHDETRKKIILNLQTAGLITYTDLMNRLEITNTGKLNYHLKKLNDLITKNDQGAYMLTERGKAAADLLEKFPSEMNPARSLHVFDAVMISFVGLLLTVIPVFLLPASDILAILLLFYLLLIPSFVMWRLTTRRANSHDLYELMKAPVLGVAFSYSIILIVAILPQILASSPPPNITTTTTTQIIGVASVVWYLLLPVIPLMGVLVIEGMYRFRRR